MLQSMYVKWNMRGKIDNDNIPEMVLLGNVNT